MLYKFVKMHGAGNDYIFMDGFRSNPIPEDPSKASIYLSRRSFSIGSDGLILIVPDDDTDARMIMYNSDGSEGLMCGNGLRCVGKYLYDLNICRKTDLSISTKSGVKSMQLELDSAGLVTAAIANMGFPNYYPPSIPVLIEGNRAFDIPITLLNGLSFDFSCVSMGNPHAISFVEDIESLNLFEIGPQIENNPIFPNRVNAGFVEVIEPVELNYRVWERGSGETLACGTGICAAVAVACQKNICPRNEWIRVNARGGTLKVFYHPDETIYLKGPAEISFVGEVEY